MCGRNNGYQERSQKAWRQRATSLWLDSVARRTEWTAILSSVIWACRLMRIFKHVSCPVLLPSVLHQFLGRLVASISVLLLGFYPSKYTLGWNKYTRVANNNISGHANCSKNKNVWNANFIQSNKEVCAFNRSKRWLVCGENYIGVNKRWIWKLLMQNISCSLAPMPTYVRLCRSEANEIHVGAGHLGD